MSVIAVIDDSDRSIQYNGVWTSFSNRDSASFEDGTATVTTTPGSTMVFSFNGTQIAVLGAIFPLNGSRPSVSAYSIDGSKVATYTSRNVSIDTYAEPFFNSDTLSSGQHNLMISVTQASENAPYVLDALGFLPLSIQSGGTYVSSTLAQPIATAVVTVNAASYKSSVPVGAIVGGVIGGVALIVVTAIALFFLCRRRGNGQAYFYKAADAGDLLSQEVKPYDLPETAQPTPAVVPLHPGPQSDVSSTVHPPSSFTQTSAPSQSYYAPTLISSPPASEVGDSSSSGYQQQSSRASSLVLSVVNPGVSRTAASPNQPYSKAAEAGLLSVPENATYHADSGVRFGTSGEPSGSGSGAGPSGSAQLDPQVPLDVPPMYTAA